MQLCWFCISVSKNHLWITSQGDCKEINTKLGANNSMVCPRNLASRTPIPRKFPEKNGWFLMILNPFRMSYVGRFPFQETSVHIKNQDTTPDAETGLVQCFLSVRSLFGRSIQCFPAPVKPKSVAFATFEPGVKTERNGSHSVSKP